MVVASKNTTNQKPQNKKAKAEPSFKESLVTYLKGVQTEWHKVTWPNRQQIVSETVIVVTITTGATLAILAIDLVLRALIGKIPT